VALGDTKNDKLIATATTLAALQAIHGHTSGRDTAFISAPHHGVTHPDIEKLTKREMEIFALIASGQSTKQVADQLGISIKTAETHRTNLMRKLDIHSASQLVRFAIRHNVIQA
jgi:DNA-binding CsgD family transcriptional regulator